MYNTIYICDSPYQLIIACCIQYDKREPAALILTDHVKGMDMIADKVIKFSSLFQAVYYVEAKKYEDMNTDITNYQIDNEILHFLIEKNIKKCKEIIIGSLLPFTIRFMKVVKCDLVNGSVSCGILEDGFATYCLMGSMLDSYKYKSDFNKIYVCNRDLLAWKPNMSIIQINRLCFNIPSFKKELNNIFSYDQLEDKYSEKYIFLASSYEEFSKLNNLNNILSILSDTVGSNNILIKNHPRIKNDIYEKKGLKTSANSVVPWEIVAMNLDLSNKVIISSFSGSLYTPCILFGKKMIGITVMNFADQEDSLGFLQYYQQYVIKQYQKYFYAPENEGEYRLLLEKL